MLKRHTRKKKKTSQKLKLNRRRRKLTRKKQQKTHVKQRSSRRLNFGLISACFFSGFVSQRSADFTSCFFKIRILQSFFGVFWFLVLFMFCFFPQLFKIVFFPRWLKETNPDSTEDSIPDSNLHGFSVFELFSIFVQVFRSRWALGSQFVAFLVFFPESSVESLFSFF